MTHMQPPGGAPAAAPRAPGTILLQPYTHIQKATHTHIHANPSHNPPPHTHKHTYIHSHAHIYAHACTHTHTRRRALAHPLTHTNARRGCGCTSRTEQRSLPLPHSKYSEVGLRTRTVATSVSPVTINMTYTNTHAPSALHNITDTTHYAGHKTHRHAHTHMHTLSHTQPTHISPNCALYFLAANI
jgi:hypothetical protein